MKVIMNIFSFLFVILTKGVELSLEVLNSCLFGILMLHSLKGYNFLRYRS